VKKRIKIQKIDRTTLSEAVAFVSRLNQELTHKISYFGDTGEEIAADFSAVQPPEGFAFIAVGEDGKPAGFFGVEMDLELGRSWLFGPLVEEHEWEAIAEQLYQAISADLPEEISKQELFFHSQNSRLENFAVKHGFNYHSEGAVLVLDIKQRQRRDGSGVTGLEAGDSAQFQALHDMLFPNTYFSAKQLEKLAKEDDKCLLVRQEDKSLAGYIFAQLRPASHDVYIDFLGVDPGFRRQGVAQDLVAHVLEWAAKKPFVENASLTVSGDNEAAISLYHSMGFSTQLVSRAYRKEI
jgi:ribosomal protein S18 acetylase RimI-like enzyme